MGQLYCPAHSPVVLLLDLDSILYKKVCPIPLQACQKFRIRPTPPKDNTKPQKTIQSPNRQYKAPKRLYKDLEYQTKPKISDMNLKY